MASIARQHVFRQAFALRSGHRALNSIPSYSTSPAQALRSIACQRAHSYSNTNLPANTTSFHSSSMRSILPAEPQRVDGTANDPVPIYPPSPTHGSYHWTFERLISLGLIPLTAAPFIGGSLNPVMDALLAAAITVHTHIGFQSVIIDYIPTKRLPRTRNLFMWGLRAGTVVVAIGIYEFETNDVGLTEAIKKIWKA